jgi:hypothetical protein
MTRLQILELPAGPGDDRPSFALVVDEYQPMRYATGFDQEELVIDEFEGVAEKIGARIVLIFRETVAIPSNGTAQTDSGETSARTAEGLRLARERIDIARDADRLAKWKNELTDALGMDRTRDWDDIRNAARGLRKRADHADKRCEELRVESLRRGKIKGEYAERIRQLETELDEARQWARHGYEIGQRHCGWTDHGVAPDWLTQGWPPHFDSCQHLQQAAEMDGQLSRVRKAIKERRTEVAEYEAENQPSPWSNAVTVTCDRIVDALLVPPPSVPVREPEPQEKPHA